MQNLEEDRFRPVHGEQSCICLTSVNMQYELLIIIQTAEWKSEQPRVGHIAKSNDR